MRDAGMRMMLRPFAEKNNRSLTIAQYMLHASVHCARTIIIVRMCVGRFAQGACVFSCLSPFEAQHDGAVHSSCHCCATQEEQEVWSLTAEKGAVDGVE